MKKIFKNGADNNVPFKNPPHESDFDKDSSLAMRLTEIVDNMYKMMFNKAKAIISKKGEKLID